MAAISQRLRRYLGEVSHDCEEKAGLQCVRLSPNRRKGKDTVSFRKRKKMSRLESLYKPPMLMVLLFVALLAGGGIRSVFATVAPGTLVGAATEPTVVSSSPSNRATNVPTSTNTSDNVVTGTAVTATFSQPMDPETVNSSSAGNSLTFTVTE